MYTTTLACSYAFRLPSQSDSRRTLFATVMFALGAIVGWPFAIALAIPFVVEEFYFRGTDIYTPQQHFSWIISRLRRLVMSGLLASAIVVCECDIPFRSLNARQLPVVGVDSLFYGKFTFASWNIITYNVFGGQERGPDLYGTSPWYFYIVNLGLNFNFVALAAMTSGPSVLVTYVIDRKRLGPKPFFGLQAISHRIAPFYLWFAILTLQPHKEERFMFPAYPLICFNAAVTLYLARGWVEAWYIKLTKSPYKVSIYSPCV
jgi:alpha-1,2-mannosyltransferase